MTNLPENKEEFIKEKVRHYYNIWKNHKWYVHSDHYRDVNKYVNTIINSNAEMHLWKSKKRVKRIINKELMKLFIKNP